jgi:hypothetical protein
MAAEVVPESVALRRAHTILKSAVKGIHQLRGPLPEGYPEI